MCETLKREPVRGADASQGAEKESPKRHGKEPLSRPRPSERWANLELHNHAAQLATLRTLLKLVPPRQGGGGGGGGAEAEAAAAAAAGRLIQVSGFFCKAASQASRWGSC